MPKLPMPTARGSGAVTVGEPGTMRLPTAPPASYGAEVGKGILDLSQAMFAVDRHLKDQRDRIDISKMELDFTLQIDALKDRVLKDADTPFDKKGEKFTEGADEIMQGIMDGNGSQTAKTAFQVYGRKLYGTHRLDIEHQGRQFEAQNQLLEGQATNEASLDRASRLPIMGNLNRPNFREVMQRMQQVKDQLAWEVAHGLRDPASAKKEQDRLFHRYWEARASNDPLTIIGLAGTGQPVDNMDMGQMDHYLDIAHAVQTRIRQEQDREQKAIQDEQSKRIEGLMWGDGETPGRDAVTEIEAAKDILTAEQYSHLREDNIKLRNLRWEITADRKQRSSLVQSDLFELAKRAKFEPQLLNNVINNAVVRDHVFNKKDLLPDDAAAVYTAISEALAYQNTGDGDIRRAETAALNSLDIFIPQQLDPKTAFLLKNMEDAMKREFRVERERAPDADKVKIQQMADDIRSRGEKRIAGLQKLRLKDVDEELFGMEQLWKPFGDKIVNENHQIDDTLRKDLEKRFPLLKGPFRMHDERRKQWEQLRGVGESEAKSAEGKPGGRK